MTRRLHPQAPRSSRPPLAHLTFSTNPLCTRAPPKHSATEMRPAIWLPMLHEDALRSSERWGRRGASALCNQVFNVRDIFFAARARSAATNMYSERGRNATERREIANGGPNILARNIFFRRTCTPSPISQQGATRVAFWGWLFGGRGASCSLASFSPPPQ